MKLQTCATFRSEAFKTTLTKTDFVHPENFGDDVVRWFMARFRERHIEFDEEDPSQEDHGWYVTFQLNELLFDLIVSYAPTAGTPRWLVSLERSVGLFGTIVGQRRGGVTPEAVRIVDEILESAEECRDVRWLSYDDVRRGKLD